MYRAILILMGFTLFFTGCQESDQGCLIESIQSCACGEGRGTQICSGEAQWEACRCSKADLLDPQKDTLNRYDFIVSVDDQCSGALIDERHVVISAHCVCDPYPKDTDMVRDSTNCTTPELIHFINSRTGELKPSRIDSMVVNPDYRVTLNQNGDVLSEISPDLTLLTLSECAPVKPIKTGEHTPAQNDAVTVVGFTKKSSAAGDEITRYFSNNIVKEINTGLITLIADAPDGTMLKQEGDQWFLAGVAGSKNAQYTDIVSWRSWIQDTIDQDTSLQSCNECSDPSEEVLCTENNSYKTCIDNGLYYRWSEPINCDVALPLEPGDGAIFHSDQSITFKWGENQPETLIIQDVTSGTQEAYELNGVTSKTLPETAFILDHSYRWYLSSKTPCVCSSEIRGFHIKDSECTGDYQKSCGMCGVATRSCNPDGSWSEFQECQNEGVCEPDQEITCENSGYKRCLENCQWSECLGQCIPETCEQLGVECGTIDDGCGTTVTCNSCLDGEFCHNNQCLICTPNEVAVESCSGIENSISERARTCSSDGKSWGEWRECTLQKCIDQYFLYYGECISCYEDPSAPECAECRVGEEDSRACYIEHGGGTQIRPCTLTGSWYGWGPCDYIWCDEGYLPTTINGEPACVIP